MAAPEDAASRRFTIADEHRDRPLAVVVALAVVTALVVGASVAVAATSGYAAVGFGFLTAVVVFVVALAVFETGRRLGADGLL